MQTTSKNYKDLILEVKKYGKEVESHSALSAWIKLCNVPSYCDDYVMIGYAVDENDVLYQVEDSESQRGPVTRIEKILTEKEFQDRILKEGSRKVKFTYFKDNGKYYSEGRGLIPQDFQIKYYSKIELTNFNNGCAPGLNGTGIDFIWLIEDLHYPPKLLID